MVRKTRHCCGVCSNFRGKVVDNNVITLHRFPANYSVRKVWIARVKLVMKKFDYNDHVRICSAHFVDGNGPTKEHDIPSVFTTKTFQTTTSSCSDNGAEPHAELEESTSLQEPTEQLDLSGSSDKSEIVLKTTESIINTSLLFHDYIGPVVTENLPTKIDKCEATITTPTTSVSTQTYFDDVTTCTSNIQTQTEILHTSEMGCQVDRPVLTFEGIKNSDEKVMFYTGIPNAGTFCALFDELDDFEENIKRQRNGSGESSDGGRPRLLRAIDEFFLVLMRLRLGLLLEDLTFRFCISKSTCSTIVDVWLDYLSVKLDFLVSWPSREVIDQTMPSQFHEKNSDCRVIIDCTEINTETPQSLANKSLMYSNYKSHMTWKALLGISPCGMITFTSDLWAGSISDKQLTSNCGILDQCEKGDSIMADKGFLISDLTTPRGIKLVMPPFKSRDRQFTRREVEETRRIANLHIHVERAMERVKNFRILQGVMPITFARKASKTWKLCCGLSNLQPPLVQCPNEE